MFAAGLIEPTPIAASLSDVVRATTEGLSGLHGKHLARAFAPIANSPAALNAFKANGPDNTADLLDTMRAFARAVDRAGVERIRFAQQEAVFDLNESDPEDLASPADLRAHLHRGGRLSDWASSREHGWTGALLLLCRAIGVSLPQHGTNTPNMLSFLPDEWDQVEDRIRCRCTESHIERWTMRELDVRLTHRFTARLFDAYGVTPTKGSFSRWAKNSEALLPPQKTA